MRSFGNTALIVLTTLLAANRAPAQRAWATPGESEAAEARQAAAKGDCDRALTLFDAAVAKRREDAALRRDRGLCHERLGNDQPARDDYAAYLSMAPDAPDAARIRARLDTVAEKAQAIAEPEPALSERERTAPLPDEPAPDETAGRTELPSRGFLFGAHLGFRDWNDDGIPGQTIAVGIEGGYAYAQGAEVDLRVVLLDSTEIDNSGFGISAAHAFKIGIDDDNRWELMAALGAGFETQINRLRMRRNFFFGRFTPSVRWSFHPSVLLQLGPEVGFGAIPAPATVVGGETDTVVGIYWGARVEVLWELEPRGSMP